jgi:hypothetical protein
MRRTNKIQLFYIKFIEPIGPIIGALCVFFLAYKYSPINALIVLTAIFGYEFLKHSKKIRKLEEKVERLEALFPDTGKMQDSNAALRQKE